MYRNVKKQHTRRETVGLIHEIGSGVSRFHRCAVKMLQSLQVHHKGKRFYHPDSPTAQHFVPHITHTASLTGVSRDINVAVSQSILTRAARNVAPPKYMAAKRYATPKQFWGMLACKPLHN